MFEFQATENSKLLKQERQFRVSLVIQLFKKKKICSSVQEKRVRSLHATEQLSPCAATIEPVLWGLGVATAEAPVSCILCSETREATTVNLQTANRE